MMTYFSIIAGIMTVGIAACIVLWILTWSGVIKLAKPRRGFEVKLNTGETPVLREKETNHG